MHSDCPLFPAPRTGLLLGGAVCSSSAHTETIRTTNKISIKFCVLKKPQDDTLERGPETRAANLKVWAHFKLDWQGGNMWMAFWRSSSFCPWGLSMFRDRRRNKPAELAPGTKMSRGHCNVTENAWSSSKWHLPELLTEGTADDWKKCQWYAPC